MNISFAPPLLSGGERGIRTPGTLLGVHTISSRALSASQASLRIFYDKLAAILKAKSLLMAERGGFEPPWELWAPKSISSRSRYDHFGISPRDAFHIGSVAVYNLFC